MSKTCQQQVRRLAGSMTLMGLGLGVLVSPLFFAIVGFVGVNLIQSTVTGVCPAEKLLPGCGTSDTTAADPV